MLHNYISVYVPGTNGLEGKLTRQAQKLVCDNVATKLSNAFGGCTSIPGTGYYVSNSGKLIQEHVIVCKAYHNKNTQEAYKLGCNIALYVKSTLSQEAVTIETQDGIEFV